MVARSQFVKGRQMATRRRITDPADEMMPSLRISHIVYGRESRGTRVVYLVDPKGGGTDKKVAEAVVLARWRRRKFENYTFSGTRLNPKIWRVLPKVLGAEVEAWCKWTEAELATKIEKGRTVLGIEGKALPEAGALKALLQVCGPSRLAALTARHNDPVRHDRYGTPDLFLYATHNETQRTSIARFVEVKKPEEPVSRDQREEIAFLQSLGLHARVLRLVERE